MNYLCELIENQNKISLLRKEYLKWKNYTPQNEFERECLDTETYYYFQQYVQEREKHKRYVLCCHLKITCWFRIYLAKKHYQLQLEEALAPPNGHLYRQCAKRFMDKKIIKINK